MSIDAVEQRRNKAAMISGARLVIGMPSLGSHEDSRQFAKDRFAAAFGHLPGNIVQPVGNISEPLAEA